MKRAYRFLLPFAAAAFAASAAQAANVNGETPRAAAAVQALQALEFSVDNLQMRRSPNGGAQVNGTVANVSGQPGSTVTLDFTFYTASGSPMGTVTQTVTLGAEDMNELFDLEFQSADPVGGYSYEVR